MECRLSISYNVALFLRLTMKFLSLAFQREATEQYLLSYTRRIKSLTVSFHIEVTETCCLGFAYKMSLSRIVPNERTSLRIMMLMLLVLIFSLT